VYKPPTPSRRLALEALTDVAGDGAYSTLALDKRLREVRLSPEDRRLATALFYGVIEKGTALEYILSKFMARPAEDAVTRENLKMAAYQIFYMAIPDYAACGEAVSLSRALGREALCPLVNAVTRRMSREKETIQWPENPIDRLSVETSTPPWLIRALRDDMGEDVADAFLRYAPEDHFTSIFVNTLRTDVDALTAMLKDEGFPVREGLVPGSLRVTGGGLADTDAFRKGFFTIQGEASTLSAIALGVKGGMQVFDACAAPGGKTFALAQMMRGSGRVHAMDIHEHRVKLIEAGAKRLGLDNVRPRVGDARQVVRTLQGQMDAVLVDAPCSGLGILGKVDVRRRVTSRDLEDLPGTQLAILESSAQLLKPGGALVYSTCTVFSAENRGVVEAFLSRNKGYELKGLARQLPESFSGKVQDGMLNLLPQNDGTDGFFIARMVKAR
jgi:16S rRNA (cytosine967-C5)-methyltransferase